MKISFIKIFKLENALYIGKVYDEKVWYDFYIILNVENVYQAANFTEYK